MGFMQGFGKKKEGARIVHCYGGPGEGGKGARKKKKKKEASNVETSFDHRLVVVVAVVSGGQKEKKKKGDAFPGPSRRGSHDSLLPFFASGEGPRHSTPSFRPRRLDLRVNQPCPGREAPG